MQKLVVYSPCIRLTGRPKTAICCVSEKIQTAYVSAIHCTRWIFRFRHFTIFERPVYFDFINNQRLRSKRLCLENSWVQDGGGFPGRSPVIAAELVFLDFLEQSGVGYVQPFRSLANA